MSFHRYVVMGLLACGGVGISHAEVKLSKQYETCMDKSVGVTSKMHACISGETQRQDARLNKAYKALTATLNSTRKKALLDTQRTWIKYRDQNCKFYVDPNGGSLAGINGGICMMETTASRATELENFLRP